MEIRLLGPAGVVRSGEAAALPRSRKVRALLAYLALSPHAVSRSHLCDLLWDVPNDPRGELRWCLSKLRGLLDDDAQRRVITERDLVRLDLDGASVDAIELDRAAQAGLERAPIEELERLCDRCAGDLPRRRRSRRQPGADRLAGGAARRPGYSIEDFLRAFHFDPDVERLYRSSARDIAFDRQLHVVITALHAARAR